MGYAALLFCPDDKTARTVTQVLSELEFAVETCTEPFATVKKLMGQHFDAIVVDCDNEQNATLIFKSARNSTSNQTSLAVAVVEGQAGVAKAFRIGANLVLTKPINIEQAKGTVRVARGLLRKGEPAKAGVPATSAPAVSKPGPGKQVAESKTAEASPSAWPLSPAAPSPAPQTALPAAAVPTAVASSKLAAHDDDLLDIDSDPPKKAPLSAAFEANAAPSTSAQTVTVSGAASAPAPARDRREWDLFEKPSQPATAITGSTAEPLKTEAPSIVGSAPSFTFGGAAVDGESEGGGKKTIVGIAAALVVAGGLYFGWAHFHSSANTPVGSEPVSIPSSTEITNNSQLATRTPSRSQSLPSKPSASLPSSSEPTSLVVGETKNHKIENVTEAEDNSDLDSKPEVEKPEPAPLVVKGGKTTSRTKIGSEAAPPSVIGLAAPGAGAPPTGLIPTPAPSLRPTLQTLNVSQGVSQGLLIKKVAPLYPQSALRMRIEGSVDLLATISKTGEITHIKIVSGDSQLSKAASEAVKQWKYKPYLLNGEPVEIQTQVTVNFKLPR